MAENQITRSVYISMVDAVNVRGRLPVRWEDRVLQYERERGQKKMRRLQHARRE